MNIGASQHVCEHVNVYASLLVNATGRGGEERGAALTTRASMNIHINFDGYIAYLKLTNNRTKVGL